MDHYAGIDVSLEASSVCVVDSAGKIVREAKIASEPAALIGWFASLGLDLARIGLEAGPLSQWLYAARAMARKDKRARLMMSAPGVGAIVALTYVSAIDDP